MTKLVSSEAAEASILLVDDDEAILGALQAAVAARFPEASITAATDSKTALGLLETRRYDVIISDYRLRAGIDGGALLQRAAHLQPRAALVALAADPDQYLVQMGTMVGFTVLTKPLDATTLMRIVGHHVRKYA